MKFKTYNLVSRAVEEGVQAGFRRACKHLDSGQVPTVDQATGCIIDAIMLELTEILTFDEEEL